MQGRRVNQVRFRSDSPVHVISSKSTISFGWQTVPPSSNLKANSLTGELHREMRRQEIQFIIILSRSFVNFVAKGGSMINRGSILREYRKQYEKKEDRASTTGRRGTTYRDPDSPPTDQIREDPDETYGDTGIQHRGSK